MADNINISIKIGIIKSLYRQKLISTESYRAMMAKLNRK